MQIPECGRKRLGIDSSSWDSSICWRSANNLGKSRRKLREDGYGEFISGGCVVFGNEPTWLLVWEEAGLTSWKTKTREAAEPEGVVIGKRGKREAGINGRRAKG